MITSLRMVNFKNFADETLRLGPFTPIVGANASGKSNIRDAFRFLHGIGRGYTLAEIMGGKYGPGGQLEWEGIRGAPNEVMRFGETEFSLHVEVQSPDQDILKVFGTDTFGYHIEIQREESDAARFALATEQLGDGTDLTRWAYPSLATAQGSNVSDLDDQIDVLLRDFVTRNQPEFKLLPMPLSRLKVWRRAAETRNLTDPTGEPLQEEELDQMLCASIIGSHLINLQFVEPSPQAMRQPTPPDSIKLGDRGENLPSVLAAIWADARRKGDLLSWLQELSPMDIAGLEFPTDPSGRVHLQILERNGRKVSAFSASDGTLRFLGLLAVLFGDNRGGFYFFEEIDNGIHPNRLWLLLDLIERQTAKGEMQIITTTHSPALLSWLRDETFENTSLVYRDEYWSDSVIRPIGDLYDLRELRKSAALGELHTEGWFEQAMKSKEGNYDTDHLEDNDEEGDVRETVG